MRFHIIDLLSWSNVLTGPLALVMDHVKSEMMNNPQLDNRMHIEIDIMSHDPCIV